MKRKDIKCNQIPYAVQNIINELYRVGYIGKREAADMIYRLDRGDTSVYTETRALLLDMAADLAKISN